MVFEFLKRGSADAPPDVGKEEEFEMKRSEGKGFFKKQPEKKSSLEEIGSVGENEASFSSSSEEKNGKSDKSLPGLSDGRFKLEVEKIKARLEVLDGLIKGFNERFSFVNQQIGEIRAMSLSNEKTISKVTEDALKTIDVVKEVKPDKLRLDFQRVDMKVQELSDKIEANKQFLDNIMNELKDLRRKESLFLGTDALLKLNEDVKKDLMEIQKTAARVKLNADKSEQIFVEVRKGFSENRKLAEIINNLDLNYSGLKKDMEKLKIDHSKILNLDDFNNFKKEMFRKFTLAENTFSEIQKVKEENERLRGIIETILSIEKKNEEDIAEIGMSLGNNRIRKVIEYDNKINSLLKIVEVISLQVNELKKKFLLIGDSVREGGVVEKKGVNLNEEKKSFEKAEISGEVNKDIEKSNLSKEGVEKIRDIDAGNVSKKTLLEAERVNLSNKKKINNKNMRKLFEEEMNELLLEGGDCLVVGDFVGAFKIYEKIRLLYNPSFDYKRIIYHKINKFYENLMKLSKISKENSYLVKSLNHKKNNSQIK